MKAIRIIVYSFVGLVVFVIAFSATMSGQTELQPAEPIVDTDLQPAKPAVDTAQLIRDGKVWVGMSESDLVKSWGKPERVNTDTYASGQHKQYVYGNRQYVYVVNGVVSAISQSE